MARLRRASFAALFVAALPVAAADGVPQAYLVPAETTLAFPALTDSNSPVVREAGEVVVFNSFGHPVVSAGPALESLATVGPVELTAGAPGGVWMESVVRAPEGTLYGYYHNEPPGVCEDSPLTVPQIGAARSKDGGVSWEDLGVVLTAFPGGVRCDTPNAYFAGGVGDFSVVLDRDGQWLYFFFSVYGGAPEDQGVAVARMPFADRDAPVGAVEKYFDGLFSEPGIDGRSSVLFPVFVPWEDPETDALWGPSVHWNPAIESYVMLLNRSVGIGWQNEGIYLSFGASLEDPRSWSEPQKLLDGGDWYPQVVGEDAIGGTDALAGRTARFFVGGRSSFAIVFERVAASAAATRAGAIAVAAPARSIPRLEPTRRRRRG
jgi:hypothetical protein